MLGLYVIAGVVGGALIVLTLVVGDHDTDTDSGGDLHLDGADVHVDHVDHVDHIDHIDHVDGSGDSDLQVDAGVWLPFLSVRFWTFFACFFGVTGSLLTWTGQSFLVTLITALLVGMGTGWLAAYAMHRLARDQVSSEVTSSDYIGQTGKVLVPVGGGKEGQIRVFIKGTSIDILAISDSKEVMPAKSEVLIIEMAGPTAKVIPVESALGSSQAPKQLTDGDDGPEGDPS